VKTKKTIVITGTHHTPAIEIIKLLKLDPLFNWEIHYIGHLTSRDTHLNNTIIPMLKTNFHHISCGKFHRQSLLSTLSGIPLIITGFFQSIKLINQIKPDIVISFGGYVSVPVIITSFLFRIPSITHEQTLTISLATKINSYFVKKIALSFDNYSQYKHFPASKVIVTGNPIRTEIFKNTSPLFSHLETAIKKKPLIYVTGGSQGSEFINRLIVNNLPKLTKFTIIHQTGQTDLPKISKQIKKLGYKNYFPISYVDYNNIGWVLNHCAFVISRSGANSCLDLHVLNKKAILIPLPIAQQNEQLLNALWLQKNHPNQILIINQADINSKLLLNAVNKLSKLPSLPANISPPKTDPLFNLIHQLV
jgi:UDP-N-acetylglucosamine--N-acetylmuramyl-(pentapeptide) pyrophosphoryl-undecaprenol N-acetylglucosamine transferase